MIRVLLMLQYPLLNHLGAYLDFAGLRFVSLVLVLIGVFLPGLSGFNGKVWVLCTGLTLTISALYLTDMIEWVYLLLPALVPLFFLIGFARTLGPDQVPLITQIGEQARGPLSAEMREYTGRLTMFWVGLFALLFLQGLVLTGIRSFGVAHVVTESTLLNVVTPGLIVGVFVFEFHWRKRRFPEHDHPSFWEYVRIVRNGV